MEELISSNCQRSGGGQGMPSLLRRTLPTEDGTVAYHLHVAGR